MAKRSTAVRMARLVARWDGSTQQERSEAASHASRARWKQDQRMGGSPLRVPYSALKRIMSDQMQRQGYRVRVRP